MLIKDKSRIKIKSKVDLLKIIIILIIKFLCRYILTESATDKRVKISSLSNRLYLNAPEVNDLRNQGMHQTMLATLDKKNVLGK